MDTEEKGEIVEQDWNMWLPYWQTPKTLKCEECEGDAREPSGTSHWDEAALDTGPRLSIQTTSLFNIFRAAARNLHATRSAPLKVLTKKDDWRHTSWAALTQTEHSKQHKQATFQPNNDFHSVCKRLEDFFQGRTEDHKCHH